MYFPPERVCCRGDNAKRESKSFPSMLADEMQTQSNQPGPIQQSPSQMPIVLLLIMCLMRNHSAGESPNLCKHTVSIDLFGGDVSLLGLTRHLCFSGSIKNDLGETPSQPGLWRQSQP